MNNQNTINGELVHCSVCESLSDFIDAADHSAIEQASKEAGASWIGRDMSTDARRKAIQAYQPGLDLLDDCRQELTGVTMPRPVTRSRRARFDEFDGDDICLDRLRSGAPFWRTTRREETSGPQTVTIGIDVAAGWNVSAKDISWRGLAGVMATELLESAGLRVELWAFIRLERTFANGNGRMIALQLKSSGAPLDVVSLVNSTAGWFFRSFILDAIPKNDSNLPARDSLGACQTIDASELSALTGVAFDAVVTGCSSRHQCIETVETIVGKFGGVAAA